MALSCSFLTEWLLKWPSLLSGSRVQNGEWEKHNLSRLPKNQRT